MAWFLGASSKHYIIYLLYELRKHWRHNLQLSLASPFEIGFSSGDMSHVLCIRYMQSHLQKQSTPKLPLSFSFLLSTINYSCLHCKESTVGESGEPKFSQWLIIPTALFRNNFLKGTPAVEISPFSFGPDDLPKSEEIVFKLYWNSRLFWTVFSSFSLVYVNDTVSSLKISFILHHNLKHVSCDFVKPFCFDWDPMWMKCLYIQWFHTLQIWLDVGSWKV